MVPGYLFNFYNCLGEHNDSNSFGRDRDHVVNTLVTGLIVVKILKVFLEVKITLIEGTLGSAAGGPNYQHVAFIIIESGMALFATHYFSFPLAFSCLFPPNA